MGRARWGAGEQRQEVCVLGGDRGTVVRGAVLGEVQGNVEEDLTAGTCVRQAQVCHAPARAGSGRTAEIV